MCKVLSLLVRNLTGPPTWEARCCFAERAITLDFVNNWGDIESVSCLGDQVNQQFLFCEVYYEEVVFVLAMPWFFDICVCAV